MDVAGPLAGSVLYVVQLGILYPRLPEEVPVHFDFHGAADSYASRLVWLFLSPSILIAVPFIVAAAASSHPAGSPPWVALAVCWLASGLVLGAFAEINRSAATQTKLRLSHLLIGPFAMLTFQSVLVVWGSANGLR
jgi:uncharacterized membrane protein